MATAITNHVDQAIYAAQSRLNEWHQQHQAILMEYKKPGRRPEDVIDIMAAQILSLRQQLSVLLINEK
jgi:hypothetical protein